MNERILNMGGQVGAAIKTAGPWGIAVVALVGVMILALDSGARADPFTGTDARQMRLALEVRDQALADAIARHETAIAEIRANYSHIMRSLDRIEKHMEGDK